MVSINSLSIADNSLDAGQSTTATVVVGGAYSPGESVTITATGTHLTFSSADCADCIPAVSGGSFPIVSDTGSPGAYPLTVSFTVTVDSGAPSTSTTMTVTATETNSSNSANDDVSITITEAPGPGPDPEAATPPTIVANTSAGTSSGMTVSYELHRATIDNVLVEDISPYLTGGQIELNHDRAIKTTAQINVRDAGVIDPETDYLAIFLNRQFDDGTSSRDQLGLFTTKVPKGMRTMELAEGAYVASDMTTVLARYAFADTYNVASGTNIVTAITTIMALAEVTRTTIPATTQTLASPVTFPIGTTYLDACNKLLDRIGYYHIGTTRDGRLTSGASREARYVEPVDVIRDADVMGTITPQPLDTSIANVVIVVNDNMIDAPLHAVRRNDDPASPTSTVNIGVRTRPEHRSDLPDQDAVNALAERLLAEGRTYYQTAQMTILPNPGLLEMHQTLDLALTGKQGILSGRWWIRTVRMGLIPGTAAPTMELNRTTDTVRGVLI